MTEDRFYHTVRWERMRQRVLRRDGYLCQEAKRYGKMVQATTVHHIFPREQYPEYEWEAWNLVSLSDKAHNEMHDRNTGELTDKGRRLLYRTAVLQGIPPQP